MNDFSKVKKILSIAGSDSGGGAGIQADIKTVSALGHYAMTAITAVTAQNTLGVSAVMPVSADILSAQLDSIFTDLRPDGIKTGMLASRENVRAVSDAFERYAVQNAVIDTVLVSTSGRRLLDEEAMDDFVSRLLPEACMITPNIPEAEVLCGMKIKTRSDMEKGAKILSGMTKGDVLIKGGHFSGDAVDVLYCCGKIYEYSSPRVNNPNTHGTGCTLSSALACLLAEGKSVPEAVNYAKEYITKVISAGFDIGSGNGPMWHFV